MPKLVGYACMTVLHLETGDLGMEDLFSQQRFEIINATVTPISAE